MTVRTVDIPERRQEPSHGAVAALTVIWLLFVAGVYVPDVGRGFIKDDFSWIVSGGQALTHPMSILTSDQSGMFYRPLVTLTFAADYALHGLHPRGFGFTNLALYLCCGVLIFAVLRQLALHPIAAAAGAFAWAVNPSGPDMAILWLSGRTSLVMTLCSCLAVLLFLRQHRVAGTLACLGALLSKEDAVALPLIIVAALWFSNRPWTTIRKDAAALVAPEVVYFWLRSGTHAITAATAPVYYRLSMDPMTVGVNLLHYLDRSGTSTAVLALATLLVYRGTPVFSDDDRRRLTLAFAWFITGLSITALVPARSTLYALFPSIGCAIAFATLVDRLQQQTARRGDQWRLQAVFASVLLLIPSYGVRNDRWVEPARVSNRTIHVLQSQVLPPSGTLVLEDESVRFSNFTDAFGGDEALAVRLFTGHPLETHVVPPGTGLALDGETVRFRLDHGAVTRVNPG